jgi:flagellar protein FlaJ
MAVAGVSPAEIFQSLSSINVYGELQLEAKKIAKEIKIMGVDSITALKHAIEISPSKKFRAFLQGIIGTIQSGSDLFVYLSNVAEKYMHEDLRSRKKDLDLLGVIAEVFVISVIAFPIFLVIILTIMGFFGGSMGLSMNILLLFSFMILPVVYAGFYLLIKSTSVEEINRVHHSKQYDIKKLFTENTLPFLIFTGTACLITLFFTFAFLLSHFGYIHLTEYFYVDNVFLSVLILIGPISLYNYREIKRKKEIQDRLPEFLVEIGDSLSTGMTIFEAIKTAEKGHYGELKPEIKQMKTKLSWNVSIKEAFTDFAAKMKSAIIERVVVTINKGVFMGGSTPKIFKAAAREVHQVNQLEDQRKKNMSIYTIVILLCFFVFLAIVLILNNTIFTSFFDMQSIQGNNIGPVLTMDLVDPTQLHYVLYSFVFVQSIGAGLLAGFMMDGNLASGVRYSCILGLVSFFIFKLFF